MDSKLNQWPSLATDVCTMPYSSQMTYSSCAEQLSSLSDAFHLIFEEEEITEEIIVVTRNANAIDDQASIKKH